MRSAGQRELGSATVELVVLTPVVVVFLLFVVAFGRLQLVRSQVSGAARAAAEAAAVAPDARAAQEAAVSAAGSALGGGGRACHHVAVGADMAGFGPGGSVNVTVRCTVSFAGLDVPGLPGSTTVTRSVTAPVDIFRDFG